MLLTILSSAGPYLDMARPLGEYTGFPYHDEDMCELDQICLLWSNVYRNASCGIFLLFFIAGYIAVLLALSF